mgnify:CR=1 FL=1
MKRHAVAASHKRNIPCCYDGSLVQECDRILTLLFSGISSEPKNYAFVALFFLLLQQQASKMQQGSLLHLPVRFRKCFLRQKIVRDD